MEQEHCFPQLPEVVRMKSNISHVHLHSNEIRSGMENEGQQEKIWERALERRDGSALDGTRQHKPRGTDGSDVHLCHCWDRERPVY